MNNVNVTRRFFSARCFYLALFFFCIFSLGAALYAQYVLMQAPCPLCILIRYIFCALIIFSVLGFFVKSKTSQAFVTLCVVLLGLGGMGLSGYLLWLKKYPLFTCGYDAVQAFLEQVPLTHWLPSLFQVQGFCQAAYPPIFGLTIAAWSLLAFVLIVVLKVFNVSLFK